MMEVRRERTRQFCLCLSFLITAHTLLLPLLVLQSEDDEDEEGEDMADDGLQVTESYRYVE
jgi:hypothetical protein